MAEGLIIINDGPDITVTTFWQTNHAQSGKFYLSYSAETFRLLVPQQHERELRHMRTAHTCVISRGPYPTQN